MAIALQWPLLFLIGILVYKSAFRIQTVLSKANIMPVALQTVVLSARQFSSATQISNYPYSFRQKFIIFAVKIKYNYFEAKEGESVYETMFCRTFI